MTTNERCSDFEGQRAVAQVAAVVGHAHEWLLDVQHQVANEQPPHSSLARIPVQTGACGLDGIRRLGKPMPRDVVVDGVTFRIDRELSAVPDPDFPADIREETMDWSGSTIGGAGKTEPTYRIGCGTILFDAQITPTAGDGVEQWQAGYIQNVTRQARSGTYADGTRICFVLPAGVPPIRDGEPDELPFSHSGEELALGTSTEVRDDDDPHEDLPRAIGGAALTTTQGSDEFVTWLALAKDEPPRKAVLLGRAVWRVDWVATVEHGQLRHTRPTPLSVVTVDENLSTQLTAAPALGDGRTYPDYRTDASMNSYSVGEMRNQLNEVTARWQYDDDGRPVAYRALVLPPDTWFS